MFSRSITALALASCLAQLISASPIATSPNPNAHTLLRRITYPCTDYHYMTVSFQEQCDGHGQIGNYCLGTNYINPGQGCDSSTCNNNAAIDIGTDAMDINKDYPNFVFNTPNGMAKYVANLNGNHCLVTQDQDDGMSCTYACTGYTNNCDSCGSSAASQIMQCQGYPGNTC